jgi:hypothetical protein
VTSVIVALLALGVLLELYGLGTIAIDVATLQPSAPDRRSRLALVGPSSEGVRALRGPSSAKRRGPPGGVSWGVRRGPRYSIAKRLRARARGLGRAEGCRQCADVGPPGESLRARGYRLPTSPSR